MEKTFEEAFERLEEILEKMNLGKVSLDESLKLFEEADKLIFKCSKDLSVAEQKVQILLKNRNGELSLDSEDKPVLEKFQTK